MDPLVARSALLAALRSQSHQGRAVGLMITASHNPIDDNGIKIIEPDGDMLLPEWEKYASELANLAAESSLSLYLEQLARKLAIDTKIEPKIVIGRDTRPSSPHLADLAIDSIRSKHPHACIIDAGLITTPQCHFLTVMANDPNVKAVEVCKQLYTEFFRRAFVDFFDGQAPNINDLILDTAHGVGIEAVKDFMASLSANKQLDYISIKAVNAGDGILNFQCGADYVKTNQCGPQGLILKPGPRYASFDGDADRLVYYYIQDGGNFRLLDGDKIAALFVKFIKETLVESHLDGISIGVVVTAYANGAATNYMHDELGVPVVFVNTGVKHLHVAAKKFDVGVYFEANGHGTIVVKDSLLERLRGETTASSRLLLSFFSIINMYVGDALADLLAIEAILAVKKMSIAAWDGLFTELPNRMLKVIVEDRFLYKTTDAERVLVEPQGLQEKINKLFRGPLERATVRPSGTEDIVRVYAEADTQARCDQLAEDIAALIRGCC